MVEAERENWPHGYCGAAARRLSEAAANQTGLLRPGVERHLEQALSFGVVDLRVG